MNALEVGSSYSNDILQAKMSIYHHHGRNMIDWIMDTSLGQNASWQSVNHTRINSYGVETSLGISLKTLWPHQKIINSCALSYSYINQDKKNEPGIVSQYALEYLKHKFTANMQLMPIEHLSLGIYYRWQDRVGQYTDFTGQVHNYKPFGLVDARLAWKTQKYTVYTEANNLLNKKNYIDYGNVPQPGIWIIAGCKINII